MKIYSEGCTLHVTELNELNATNAPVLRDNVRAALKADTRGVELDMSDTKFIDSSGLGVLIALQKILLGHPSSFRIVNPTSTVVQILELTRLHRVIEIARK